MCCPGLDIENGVETRTLQVLAFDVVLRDFSVEHPDFENFSEEYVSTGDGNYCTKGGSTSCGDMILEKGYLHYDAYWHADLAPYHYTCGNFRSKTGATIGTDGFSMVQNPFLPPYLQVASATGKALEYGQCADGYDRNFVNANLTEYVGKIYVDGVLAVDLGGTHNAAPGAVDIRMLAMNNHGCHAGESLAGYSNCDGASDGLGWADNSWHHIHFFYANRQTEGAGFLLRTNLAEIAPPRYSQK